MQKSLDDKIWYIFKFSNVLKNVLDLTNNYTNKQKQLYLLFVCQPTRKKNNINSIRFILHVFGLLKKLDPYFVSNLSIVTTFNNYI
jgi:hypothetical protein